MNKLKETNWRDIDWVRSQENVNKWQSRIYLASKIGDIKEVRRCQHAVLGLLDSKLIAVRQITQDNKYPPGIDNVDSIPSNERIELARSLRFYTPGSPLRRIWIPKPGTHEKRPLSIPSIKDRCLQALFKTAIEPEWEAKFENNCYGFRRFSKGRSCHAAVVAVQGLLAKRENYILDADISKCFDLINHEYLLNKLGFKGKYRKQVKSWLKCGIIDRHVFGESNEGIPKKGGMISPLLANIALDGMERFCRESIGIINIPDFRGDGRKIQTSQIHGDLLGIVRYADHFLLIHPHLDTILFLEKELDKFLSPIGVKFSERKTQITHSLNLSGFAQAKLKQESQPNFSEKPGFNFLSFYFRQYPTVHRSIKSSHGQKLGFRLLIIPTKAKQLEHQANLHRIILKEGKGLTQDNLIFRLNPVISGWSLYYASSMGILKKMDYLTYLKLRRWAKRIYKGTGKGITVFRRIGVRNWVFSTDKSTLVQHIDYSRPLNIKVKGASL